MTSGRRPKLSNFMLNLTRDPQMLADFQRDPQTAAQAAGLSPDAIQAIASRDPLQIHQAVLADGITLPVSAQANDDINVTVVVVLIP